MKDFPAPPAPIVPWTRAHDIAVEVSGLDPRTQRYPVEEWAPYQRNKWECALEAAQMAIADFNIPVMSETDLVVGVVKSDDGKGSDTRVMVKQWDVGDDGPPRITFGIYCGGGHWVEAAVTPDDAMKVVALILDKPVFGRRAA